MSEKKGTETKSMFDSFTDGISSTLKEAGSTMKEAGGVVHGYAEKVPGVSQLESGLGSVAGGVMDGVGSVTGGVTSSFTVLMVLNTDTKAKVMGLSPFKLAKIGRIIKNMQKSKYKFTDSEVDLVVKALYVSQKEADFRAAFEMLDAKLNGFGQGGLKAQEFREVLPLVGENIEADKMDEFFKEVDADGSGVIEFDEFQTLMLKMNPAEDHKFSAAQLPGAGLVTSGWSAVGDTWSTMSVLRATTQAKLAAKSPLSMTRIGRIIKAMQASEYKFDHGQIDDTIRAIYVTKTDEDQNLAFNMFDQKLSESGSPQGYLSAEAFKKLIPLLGENVDPVELENKFKEVDADGSGKIEFNEFQALVATLDAE